MTEPTQDATGASAGALWYGWLVPPLTFGADLLLSYALVPHACSTGHFYVLHVVTVVAIIVTLSAGFFAWREYLRVSAGADDEGGSPRDRAHFMAIFGMIWSAAFVVVILANAVPRLMLSPCD
jgi:hypothetical protein